MPLCDKIIFAFYFWKVADCRWFKLIIYHSSVQSPFNVHHVLGLCDNKFLFAKLQRWVSNFTTPIHYKMWNGDSYQCQAHYNFLLLTDWISFAFLSRLGAHSNFLWWFFFHQSEQTLNHSPVQANEWKKYVSRLKIIK